jgi:hypothetical protein
VSVFFAEAIRLRKRQIETPRNLVRGHVSGEHFKDRSSDFFILSAEAIDLEA